MSGQGVPAHDDLIAVGCGVIDLHGESRGFIGVSLAILLSRPELAHRRSFRSEPHGR